MKPRILILSDPYGKPSFAPRLRFVCDYLSRRGYPIAVYTERWEALPFEHDYPIYEVGLYKVESQKSKVASIDWAIKSLWSLLTNWKSRAFARRVRELTEGEVFDLVFCTTFSTFPLCAAAAIASERGVPLIADIRDLDEQVPDSQYQYHRQWWARIFRPWYRNINIRRRNRALRAACAVTTVSPWHVDFIRAINDRVHLIYNGFDPSQFYQKNHPCPTFLISYIGRLYDFQDLSPVREAVEALQLPDVELNLHLPDKDYIPIRAVGDEIRRSSIMLVLTGVQTHGMMTTKFFEALGCEKPVLCVPSDHGCLAEVIAQTNAGIATGDVETIKKFILYHYHEWKRQGYTHQPVRDKDMFNRLYQARQFEDLFRHSARI